MANDDPFTKIDKSISQLSMEIVMAEAGSDAGQLPIRALLADLNDLAQTSAPHLEDVTEYALRAIDGIMDDLRPFEEADIQILIGLVEQIKAIRNDPERPFTPPSGQPTTSPTPPPTPSLQPETPSAQTDEPAAPPVPAPSPAPAKAEEPKEEPSIAVEDIADADLMGDFMTEAVEHLDNIEQGILQLETNPKDRDTLNTVFRAFHTLKGGAGFLNLIPIQSLAHELESLLDLARQDKLTVTSDIINLILEGKDTIRGFIEEIQLQAAGQKPSEPIRIPTLDLIWRVNNIVEGRAVPGAEPSAPPPAEPETDISVPETSTATSLAQPEPASVANPAPTDSASTPPPSPAPASAPSVAQEEEPRKEKESSVSSTKLVSTVKVDTDKLDNLFDMVGEMVIAQSLISQDQELQNLKNPRITRNLSLLSRITNELQKTAMALRMVPIRGTFQKMNRVVRDVAAKAGKQVTLNLKGEDTELDRTIVEEISDPLIHMVRNSVDHGVEKPEVRTANGKPAVGQVTLDAFHQGGNIVIQIRDDGAGLNPEKLRAKAIERGVVSPDQKLSDREIFALIFEPGFSTAEKITDISGRGVGMDVVRRNIEKLRGKVEIESVLGKGTTFSIFLPLTLAIIEGLIVQVADQRYIIPTLSVKESFRPMKESVSTVQERGEIVNVRGGLLPLMRLYETFGLKPVNTDISNSIAIVVESAHRQRCVVVDNLLGKQEVVIKSLSEQLRKNKYLAGAAILGDGQVGLILNTAELVNG